MLEQPVEDRINRITTTGMVVRIFELPQDLWLEKITVDRSGQVALGGSSLREGTIYNFVGNLEPAPGWSQAAIEGTSPASTKFGPMTRFDIQCKFDARPEPEREGKRE